MEIVIAGSNSLYVYHHDGTVVPGWPKSYGLYSKEPSSGVALADIDGDEDLEIVVSTEGHFSYSGTGKVFVWHHDGTSARGWPKTIEGTRSHPAIGDVDGDGQNDVVVPASTGEVYAWSGSGELLEGWPVMRSQTSATYAIQAGAALADVDKDGDLEIFVGSSQRDSTIYAWHHDGSPVEGWPIEVSRIGMFRSPVLGDIDKDGALEVIASLDLTSSDSSSLYVWEINGSVLGGWPRGVSGGGTREVPLADLDQDGDLEIFACTDLYADSGSGFGVSGSIQAWHHDGSTLQDGP